jgi:hypothetical protein
MGIENENRNADGKEGRKERRKNIYGMKIY